MGILIIGGSRFVGHLVIDTLLKHYHKVTVFNRGQIQSDYRKEINFIKGDRNKGFEINEHFDVVIDTCAYAGSQTKTAIEQLSFDFFVNLGTAASYKKTELFPLTESSPLGDWPLWGDYNKGKVECERILEKSGVKFATIRPVYILGPKNYVDREHFIYSRIKKGLPLILPGDGEAIVQFVFAKDVAKSIVLLVENKIEGAFNCAGNEVITLIRLVEEMGKIMELKPTIQFNPDTDQENFDEKEFPFANENFFCSNEKLRNLGIAFTPLLRGLKEDYENYYKHIS